MPYKAPDRQALVDAIGPLAPMLGTISGEDLKHDPGEVVAGLTPDTRPGRNCLADIAGTSLVYATARRLRQAPPVGRYGPNRAACLS
jgi:hypothetical protein